MYPVNLSLLANNDLDIFLISLIIAQMSCLHNDITSVMGRTMFMENLSLNHPDCVNGFLQ